jgi:hypothetical protein
MPTWIWEANKRSGCPSDFPAEIPVPAIPQPEVQFLAGVGRQRRSGRTRSCRSAAESGLVRLSGQAWELGDESSEEVESSMVLGPTGGRWVLDSIVRNSSSLMSPLRCISSNFARLSSVPSWSWAA